MRTNQRSGRLRALLMTLAVGALAPACTSSAAAPAPRVGVELQDFTIQMQRAALRRGTVEFVVHNAGPTSHEFVIARTSVPLVDLPIAADGVTFAEGDRRLHKVLDVPVITRRTTTSRRVRLTSGHYVAFCNLPGHYLGGMRLEFEVP